MSLDTPAAVVLAILFLIPGLIWKKMADLASPYRNRKKVDFLECFMFSCWNYLVAGVFFGWAYIDRCPADIEPTLNCVKSHFAYFALWVLPVFVLPAGLGFAATKLARRESIRARFCRYGIYLLHPAPTAWDFVFAREESYRARVELLDGKLLEGLFGSGSLASTEEEERDLFLEGVYEIDEASGGYSKVKRNQGVWIHKDQIKAIRFFSIEEGSK